MYHRGPQQHRIRRSTQKWEVKTRNVTRFCEKEFDSWPPKAGLAEPAVLLCSFPAWSQQPPMDQTALLTHSGHKLPPVGSNKRSTKWEASAARLLINPEPILSEP